MQHPCTKRLRVWASEERQSLMEQWAKGHFSAAFETEMAVKNAGATGACSVYIDIAALDFQQIGERSDEEQVGTDPVGAGSTGKAL